MCRVCGLANLRNKYTLGVNEKRARTPSPRVPPASSRDMSMRGRTPEPTPVSQAEPRPLWRPSSPAEPEELWRETPSPSPDDFIALVPLHMRQMLFTQRVVIDNARSFKQELPDEEKRLMDELEIRYGDVMNVSKTMAKAKVMHVIAAANTRADEAITEANERIQFLEMELAKWYREGIDEDRRESLSSTFREWVNRLKPLEVVGKSMLEWEWNENDLGGEIVGVPPNMVVILSFSCERVTRWHFRAEITWIHDNQIPIETFWVGIATEDGRITRSMLTSGTTATFSQLWTHKLYQSGGELRARICAGNQAGFGEISECATTLAS